jgi:hypothetical protein
MTSWVHLGEKSLVVSPKGLGVKTDWDIELSLSQLRVAVMRTEKLVAEIGGSSGTQMKGNSRR